MVRQPSIYEDLQRVCGIRFEPVVTEVPTEILPCRYCDCIDFDIQDKTRDQWRVFCGDCTNLLGEVSDLEALIWVARIHGYQRGWVYHEYLNFNAEPNIEELREVEYVLGYQRGWAEHAYRELYEGAEVDWLAQVTLPQLKLGGASLFFRDTKV
ncbi:hypothetical protein [Candidatus Cyanaurora vandensis]|uniref:hypothetical protein n=1 Tax=Candidatus Cyanaurora vandensis TaxID=2714958 RepID=UPI00257D53AE|nr:hypothetical protein [Candidatus Cyanaurora vandensis]